MTRKWMLWTAAGCAALALASGPARAEEAQAVSGALRDAVG